MTARGFRWPSLTAVSLEELQDSPRDRSSDAETVFDIGLDQVLDGVAVRLTGR